MGNATQKETSTYLQRDHSKGSLQKRIASIGRRGAKLDRDIHETAVDCLAHASENGDVTLLTNLYHAMPKGSRRKAMAKWATDHVEPLKTKGKDDAFAFGLKKGWKPDEFRLEAAEATPFWEHTDERAPTPFDLEKALDNFVRRLTKAYEEGECSASVNAVEREFHERLQSVNAKTAASSAA